MKAAGAPRWALTFADLALVLLAFFVLLQAHQRDRGEVAASVRAAFGGEDSEAVTLRRYDPERLFEPGEARLTPAGRSALTALGTAAGGTALVTVTGLGKAADAHRFDGWELSAARVAAVGRVLVAAGVPADRMTLDMPGATPAAGSPKKAARAVIAVRIGG